MASDFQLIAQMRVSTSPLPKTPQSVGNFYTLNPLGFYSPPLAPGMFIQLYNVVINSVLVDQPITVADIREWHCRWVGNVYVWAGQDRTVNMGKEDFQFATSRQIPRLLDQLGTDILATQTPCMGMAEDRLVEAITVVHVELILIHPFREGNGRLSRVLAGECYGITGGMARAGFHGMGRTQG